MKSVAVAVVLLISVILQEFIGAMVALCGKLKGMIMDRFIEKLKESFTEGFGFMMLCLIGLMIIGGVIGIALHSGGDAQTCGQYNASDCR